MGLHRIPGIVSWLVLGCILVAYIALVFHLTPTSFFGFTEDDSIYFSSAKALAEGKGYVLPSVPGTPPATKYPILYPWLLSWVWRWNPSFPVNLAGAVAVNAAFGCMFVVFAFLFLRSFTGIGGTGVLVLTAVCALNPTTIFYSIQLMSDIPFAALVLAACVLAKRVEQRNSSMSAALSGALSGLAILVRVLGAPVAVGLGFAIALRSGWRKVAIFAASVFPFVAFTVWRSLAVAPKMVPTALSTCSDTWSITWLYYTNYTALWKAQLLSAHVFWSTLWSNLGLCLLQPGDYFLDASVIRPEIVYMALLVILSAVSIRGIVRNAQSSGLQEIHPALLLYLAPLLIWTYGSFGRFLIPFMPLMAGAIWVETDYLCNRIGASFNNVRAAGEKSLHALLSVARIGTGIAICVFLWRGNVLLAHASQMRAELLREKIEAYSWLKENSPAEARFVAYEDGSAFLYSGRQGLRPAILSPSGMHRPEILNADLSCITSSAQAIGARYWIISDDDFGFEWEPAPSRAISKQKEMEASLRQVFRSQHGGVRIYELVPAGQPLI